MAPGTSGITSIELLLDAAAEAVVRAEWEALASAGMSSMAGHEAASNRPHVTLLARSTPVPHPLLLAAIALPLPVLLGPPLLFGDGDRRVLARSVVPSAELLALHQAVLSASGDGDSDGQDDGDGRDSGAREQRGRGWRDREANGPWDGDGDGRGDAEGHGVGDGRGHGVSDGRGHGVSDGRGHGVSDGRGHGVGDGRDHFAPGRWTPHVTLARRIRLVDLPQALRLLRPPIDAIGVALRRWDAATATVSSIDIR